MLCPPWERSGSLRSSALVAILGVSCVGSYNKLVRLDQAVDGQWAQVENAYQRRADLVPNLVETVKGAAKFEKETFTAVTEARRARSGRSPRRRPRRSSTIRQAMQRFQQAQDGLSSALSRLLVVSEQYPELKATANFRDLQAQLEGTENRIAVERMRFNEAAQEFNTTRNSFPTVLIAGMFGNRFAEKSYFKAQAGAATAPQRQVLRRTRCGRPASRPAPRLLALAAAARVGRRARAETPDPGRPRALGDRSGRVPLAGHRRRSSTRASATTIGQTGHQVLVYIDHTTGGVPIEDWAVKAFERWRVGRKGIDDGLVLFVFSDDHKLRIEVGYGLEDRVPDAVAVADHQRADGRRASAPATTTAPSRGGVDALVAAIGAPAGAGRRRPSRSPAGSWSLGAIVLLLS